ncbi:MULTISPECIES: Rieske 2Fe-2S domain-containing protein [unclassified Modestobacter]
MAFSWAGGTRGTGARTAPGTAGGGTGWYPVARSADVGTTPVPVGAGGQPFVVVRLAPDAEVTAVGARCPHRLVPLTTATVVDGRLQCGYHGWQFNAEGRCTRIPALGPHGAPPPRADLPVPWAVEERDGWVWLAPDRTPVTRPPRAGGSHPAPDPEQVPELPEPAGPVFGNLDPALEHAWHPVALAGELREGGYVQVRLLGRNWTVRRQGGALDADPPAWGVTERLGLIWLAPDEPRDRPLPVPEADDPRYSAAWLTPARTSAPAGPLIDAFVDVAHVPFVHATAAGLDAEVPDQPVAREPGGFCSRQERAVEDGVLQATYVHRAPFQLLLRLTPPDGAGTTVLTLLQPEDADSTRVFTCLFLAGADGQPVPAEVVAAEVAAEQAALTEDLRLVAGTTATGLPLLLRDELHVRSDRLGVALRRALADFAAECAALDRTTELQHRASA